MPPLDDAGARLAGTLLERAWRAPADFAIVGTGALGSEVFRQLCVLRPRRVLLIDPDSVQETDLAKSWMFGPESVGCAKARHLAALGRAYSPRTEFRVFTREFADVGWQDLAGTDLVFACVDTDLARLEIAVVARKLAIPVCDAGLADQGASAGRVTWFPKRDGACFGCKLRPRRLRELLVFSQAEVRSCSLALAGGFSLSPTMASLIASLQVDFGIRGWLADMQGSESIEIALEPDARVRRFENPISAACPLHENQSAETRIETSPGATFGGLLQSTRPTAGAIVLDWPYCVWARCLECGNEWQPFVRCAILRRNGRCPACSTSAIIELDSVKVIENDSPWAGFTPEQIGLPSNHLLTLRQAAHE